MKKVIFFLIAASLISLTGISHAQSADSNISATESPTPANVLKWTKEVLPKMELLVPKLEKIKMSNTGKPGTDALRLLATVNQLKEINAKGTRLKAAEAKNYYNVIAATVNGFYVDCRTQTNNVCCIDCQKQGIQGAWCFANCFVSRYPPRT